MKGFASWAHAMSNLTKPAIPDVLARFEAYRADHPVWGSLHVVLEDENLSDDSVRHCIGYARETGDAEGEALGEILLTMSKTQRLRLARL